MIWLCLCEKKTSRQYEIFNLIINTAYVYVCVFIYIHKYKDLVNETFCHINAGACFYAAPCTSSEIYYRNILTIQGEGNLLQ